MILAGVVMLPQIQEESLGAKTTQTCAVVRSLFLRVGSSLNEKVSSASGQMMLS